MSDSFQSPGKQISSSGRSKHADHSFEFSQRGIAGRIELSGKTETADLLGMIKKINNKELLLTEMINVVRKL